LTTPRSSKSPFSDSVDAIEILVNHRWALPQHSYKTLGTSLADLIAAEFKLSERWTLC
jgi:hypothetical protein